MRNRILIVGVLAVALTVAGGVYAADPKSGADIGNQVQQQTKIANQGDDSQIKTQNNEQIQNGDATDKNLKITRTQKFQDGDEAGGQVQNQNQIKNQGEENQIKNNEQEGVRDEKSDSVIAEQRRSQVANAAQEMLQIADRNGGIGQQVRIIAQTQTQNQEKLEESLEKVQSRGGFVKFFAGPNYGEINNAKRLLEQNREQIEQLNQIKTQLSNQGDQQTLIQQIQTLEQANLQIENSLGTAQKGFSLLGWMFKLFAK